MSKIATINEQILQDVVSTGLKVEECSQFQVFRPVPASENFPGLRVRIVTSAGTRVPLPSAYANSDSDALFNVVQGLNIVFLQSKLHDLLALTEDVLVQQANFADKFN